MSKKLVADGVPSHGLNRVPRTLAFMEKGYIDPRAACTQVAANGVQMVLDGNLGFGNVNARDAMDKACDLARQYGAGVVSVRNTNHWLRGGAYGWQAANQGLVSICWSNTRPNMVPWGGTENVIGNNPFVLAVPRAGGRHVVVDSAMSQFSFGKIQSAAKAGEPLPFPGGYDRDGNLTAEPGEILDTMKSVPMGYWKGSGLSLLLDLIGGLLSGGNTVTDVGRKFPEEMGLTQVMIVMKPHLAAQDAEQLADRVLDAVKSAGAPGAVRYPGEREYNERAASRREGIAVDAAVWSSVAGA